MIRIINNDHQSANINHINIFIIIVCCHTLLSVLFPYFLLFVVTLFFLCYSLISCWNLMDLPWVRYGWYILLDFHWNFLHTGLLQVLQIYEWRHLLSIFITGYIHLLRTVWHNSRLIHTEAQYSGQHRTNVNHPRVYMNEMDEGDGTTRNITLIMGRFEGETQ